MVYVQQWLNSPIEIKDVVIEDDLIYKEHPIQIWD